MRKVLNVVAMNGNGQEIRKAVINTACDIVLGGISAEQTFHATQADRYLSLLDTFQNSGLPYDLKSFEGMIAEGLVAWPTRKKDGVKLAASSCKNVYEPALFIFNWTVWLKDQGYGVNKDGYIASICDSRSYILAQKKLVANRAKADKDMAAFFGISDSKEKDTLLNPDDIPSDDDGLVSMTATTPVIEQGSLLSDEDLELWKESIEEEDELDKEDTKDTLVVAAKQASERGQKIADSKGTDEEIVVKDIVPGITPLQQLTELIRFAEATDNEELIEALDKVSDIMLALFD